MPKKEKSKPRRRYEASVTVKGEVASVVGRLLYEELGLLGIEVSVLARESLSDEVPLPELLAELRKKGSYVSIVVEDE